MPLRPKSIKFNPQGSGYDTLSAKLSGMKRDKTGHMGSRNPKTGQILKGRKHKTFSKTVVGEKKAGFEIFKGNDGRLFSRKKKKMSLRDKIRDAK